MKQKTKPNQDAQLTGIEAIKASSGKVIPMPENLVAEQFPNEAQSYRKEKIASQAQLPDRYRVATAGKLDQEINKFAWRIMQNLKHFHECGRKWEAKLSENGERVPMSISHAIPKRSKKLESIMDWSETGKVKPLSDNDMDEIFLAARASLLESVENQRTSKASVKPSLEEAWKDAARAARRELYLITREQTFASRTRAETYSAKAKEFSWQHYGDLVELQGFAIQDTLMEYFSESHDLKALAKRAKQAIATRWQAKSCYDSSKMLRNSTLQAIRQIGEFVQLIENKQFVLPKRKTNQRKCALQQALERLALKIREGKDLQVAWNKGLELMALWQRKKRIAKKVTQVIEINKDAPIVKTHRCHFKNFAGGLMPQRVTEIVTRKVKLPQASESELLALKLAFK